MTEYILTGLIERLNPIDQAEVDASVSEAKDFLRSPMLLIMQEESANTNVKKKEEINLLQGGKKRVPGA